MCCRCLLAASWMNRSASAGVHSLTVDAFLACVTPKHLCAVPMSSGRNVVVMNWLNDEAYGWNDWKDLNRFAPALIEVAVPAPGAIALLSLAGLTGRRRRRA